MTEYLFCIGAAKAGTTLLYKLLADNPQFDIGKKKELHYFDTAQSPSKQDYDALFKRTAGVKLDISPSYMFFDGCMKTITDTIPIDKMKCVALLRDPVERALSHYRMARRRGYETKSFDEALALEPERIAKSKVCYKRNSFFARGMYSGQLDELYSLVPRESVKIYLFEDFIKDQQAVVDDLMDWLGLERFTVKPAKANVGLDVRNAKIPYALRVIADKLPRRLVKYHRYVERLVERLNKDKSGRYKDMSPQTRQMLIERYTPDVRRLKSEYGVDVSKWKNFGDMN